VLRFLLVFAAAVVVLGLLRPSLARWGLGRLPGDLRFERRGRTYYFPLTTTLLLSAALTLLLRLFGR
jgi:hypothetical protein